jgi:predicted lysophospholipase L1 biosynthesis ABC-type transport system permease subunit
MAPGSTPEAVLTELTGLVSRLPELFPDAGGQTTFLAQVQLGATVQPLKEALVGELDTTLWILLGTVGFVLLIACANVANLLLVRAEARQRELALRIAIGAGRREVMRASMSESLVLAVLGGAIGVGVAALAVAASDLRPATLPRAEEIGVDLRVLAFTAAVTLGCAAFFGLLPLLRLGDANLLGSLREGAAHGSTSGRGRHMLRNSLVVTQMALALILLIGSGLMFRSFQALRRVRLRPSRTAERRRPVLHLPGRRPPPRRR